jgi:hypothetical protein
MAMSDSSDTRRGEIRPAVRSSRSGPGCENGIRGRGPAGRRLRAMSSIPQEQAQPGRRDYGTRTEPHADRVQRIQGTHRVACRPDHLLHNRQRLTATGTANDAMTDTP